MNLPKLFFLLAVLCGGAFPAFAQVDSTQAGSDTLNTKKLSVIKTNDGGEFVGVILSQDAREILIRTKDRGDVIIPKYQVKEIKEVHPGELSAKGDYIPNEVFSTRYFLTTNGLPIEKGESYILWNLWGVDAEFAVGKNMGVGVMSSWMGMPIIGTFKYSIKLKEKMHLGLGVIAGTGSWASPDYGGALPFATLTFGDRRRNFTVSGGYGALAFGDGIRGRAIFSVAGMSKVGKKVSLVFDSFLIAPGPTEYRSYVGYGGQVYTSAYKRPGGALLVPGIRVQTQNKAAFQVGFGGLIADNELMPFPIPFFQWFRMI
jgi:hypothetical protein